RKMAEGDDEEMAAKAKKALAAFEDEDEGEDEKKDDAESKAEDEEKDSEAKAASRVTVGLGLDDTTKAIGALSAEVVSLKAKLEAKEEAEERAALLASRPDLPEATVAWLKKQPLSVMRGAVESMPKAGRALVTPPVAATRGEGQVNGGGSRLPPDQKAELDRRMGLAAMTTGIINTETKLILGAPGPATKKGS